MKKFLVVIKEIEWEYANIVLPEIAGKSTAYRRLLLELLASNKIYPVTLKIVNPVLIIQLFYIVLYITYITSSRRHKSLKF